MLEGSRAEVPLYVVRLAALTSVYGLAIAQIEQANDIRLIPYSKPSRYSFSRCASFKSAIYYHLYPIQSTGRVPSLFFFQPPI